ASDRGTRPGREHAPRPPRSRAPTAATRRLSETPQSCRGPPESAQAGARTPPNNPSRKKTPPGDTVPRGTRIRAEQLVPASKPGPLHVGVRVWVRSFQWVSGSEPVSPVWLQGADRAFDPAEARVR